MISQKIAFGDRFSPLDAGKTGSHSNWILDLQLSFSLSIIQTHTHAHKDTYFL